METSIEEFDMLESADGHGFIKGSLRVRSTNANELLNAQNVVVRKVKVELKGSFKVEEQSSPVPFVMSFTVLPAEYLKIKEKLNLEEFGGRMKLALFPMTKDEEIEDGTITSFFK